MTDQLNPQVMGEKTSNHCMGPAKICTPMQADILTFFQCTGVTVNENILSQFMKNILQLGKTTRSFTGTQIQSMGHTTH